AKAESDRKLEGLQLFLEKLQSEQQMLSTDKANLEQQLEDARQQNTAFENEKANDARRSDLLKSRFDALQALHDAQEASFENERAELQQRINSLQSQINSNYVDNDGAQGPTIQSSPDIEAQLSAAEASRLELQNALNDVTQTHQNEKDALLAEVLELQQQLEEARAKAVSNRPQEQLRDDAATDQAPLDAEPVMGQSDASENSLLQIEALQKELAQLGDELKRRESEHTQTLRHMNKAHEADYEELSEQLSVAQSQTQQKNTQVTELEKRVETLENDLEAAKAAGGQPKSEIFAPERQHKALLMHLERAEADLDDAEEQIEQLEAELEQKEAELQNIKLSGPSSLPSGNEGSSSELVRLQQQLQEIEQENMIELDSKVKALEEAKIQIQQLREGGERAAILEDLLSNTQSENNVLLAENDDLQDEIAQLRESLLRARSENESRTEDPIPEFQSSLGKPEEQLQVLHEEYQSELRKA
ncbi:MAG: hypothetical protein VX026_13050, partial [Myxococcota bacterium]|nr:hypothetical protein [Myxococcota bacterium]